MLLIAARDDANTSGDLQCTEVHISLPDGLSEERSGGEAGNVDLRAWRITLPADTRYRALQPPHAYSEEPCRRDVSVSLRGVGVRRLQKIWFHTHMGHAACWPNKTVESGFT